MAIEKLIQKEIISNRLCIHKPETTCDKNYCCIKLDDIHEAYIKNLRKRQVIRKNPFVYHTFHVTPRPGFICPSKLSNELKKMMGVT